MLDRVEKYEEDHKYKFMGAGISVKADKISPILAPRLWMELDIVPVIISHGADAPDQPTYDLTVDEEADSMARKCIMYDDISMFAGGLILTHHAGVLVPSSSQCCKLASSIW